MTNRSERDLTRGQIPIGSWRGVLARRHSCTLIGWLTALYDRLLISRVGHGFPLRGRVVPVRLQGVADPFFVRLGSSDWMSLDEIFIRNVYGMASVLNMGRAPCIVDLGANVGFSARYWRMLFPGATIVAVEPEPSNAKMCRLNMQGHELGFHLYEAFVGARRGYASLDFSDGSAWEIRMGDCGSTKESAVPVTTVPDLLRVAGLNREIDLLKCDIEGAERQLFGACESWIHGVRNLFIEVHGAYDVRALLGDLRRNGANFTCKKIAIGEAYGVYLLQRGAD